jgi:uncharacterized membrane protein
LGKLFVIHRRESGARRQNARNQSARAACPEVIPLDKQVLSPLYFEGFTRRRRWAGDGFGCRVMSERTTDREWLWKRNCSISPRQLGMVYGALCLASLMVATFFTVRGAWYVLGFAILEMAAVGLAFLHFGRHATDREHIALIDDCLVVEVIQAEHARRFELNPRRTQVDVPQAHADLIGLESGATRIEVGRFLTEWKRREFARELRQALQRA